MFYDVFCMLCEMEGKKCNTVASEIGLSNSIVTKWKKTGATPNGKTLAKLSQYFKMPVEAMIGSETELRNAMDGVKRDSDAATDEIAKIIQAERTKYYELGKKEKDPTVYSEADDELIALYGECKAYFDKDDIDDIALFMKMKADRKKQKGEK